MTNEELKELAAQLRKPSGAKGTEVAGMMNETNIRMTLHSIDRLHIQDHDHILELGHGNCAHLSYILQQKSNLAYYGLEISELMKEEAKHINQRFIENKKARFYLYDGQHIPFPGNYFDRIFTVNTIYFWTDPESLMSELYHVIKPNGKLNITFVQQDMMKALPFTQFGFTLYNNKKIEHLVETTGFKIAGSDSRREVVKSKTGHLVDRVFTTITLEKPENN